MNLEKVDLALERLDVERDEAVRRLLQPLVQTEFDRVRKRRPELERIIFGNGTYVLVGWEPSLWRTIRIRDTLSGAAADVELACPKYMHKLVLLCERAAHIALEDVLPS